jgi:glycosyltransferase involved in cell wall biosynthesis
MFRVPVSEGRGHRLIKPLSIGMVISRFPPFIGGTEIQCYRLSRALAARGHRVVVITELPGASLSTEENVEGIRVVRLHTSGHPPFSWFSFGFRLMKRLRSEEPFDILHSYMIAMPALATLGYGQKVNRPVLVKIAGADKTGEIYTSQQTPLGLLKFYLFKRWSQFIACPSVQAVRELENLGIKSKKIYLIPNGIDVERFTPISKEEKQSLRKTWGLQGEDLIAVYAGRPAAGKGVDTLLSMWAQAASQPHFHWKLIVLLAAEGELRKEYEDKFRMMTDRVLVVFNEKDVQRYYQAADVALLLSRGEGLSNFLLETMACGLPHIVTPPAAVTEEPRRQEWSWVMDSEGDPGRQAFDLLMTLEKDPDLLSRKGAAARKTAEENYSIQRTTDAYEKVYQEMAGAS